MSKIIVTGGCGFIGSHLVDRLVDMGHEVIVFDDESSGNRPYHNESSQRYLFDITADFLPNCPVLKDTDVIFHLAAKTQVQYSIDEPVETYKTNHTGTLSILEAARKNNIRRVILSSTAAIYGDNDPPHSERHEQRCLSPYAFSKYSAENLCKMYNDVYGVETISLRYFNVYGDRMPMGGSYSPVISKFLQQRDNNEPLTITGDGKQQRDFVHVSDVVSANIHAMQTDNDRCFGNVFNVGSGVSYSISEIASLISPNIDYINAREGEVKDSLADINKTKAMLRWKPRIELDQWIKESL